MIPIGDDNPTLKTPVMTFVLLGATIGSWLVVQGAGFESEQLAASVCNFGLVPGEVTGQAPVGQAVRISELSACVVDREPINIFTPITSMFLHGSWGHLLGNMLFFWVFGNNVEDSMGRARFLAFYLICGIAAAVAHMLVQPASPVPTVGASGAVSGIMGAYLLLYPQVRVRMLFFFLIFFKIVRIRAWLVLLFWFGWQVLTGLPELTTMRTEISGGVAVWAHVGGFVAGALLIKLFERSTFVAERNAVRGIRTGEFLPVSTEARTEWR